VRCEQRQDARMNPINDNAQLITLLTMFLSQLPILLISVVGCMMMVGRWNEGSRAAGWALLGFGLSVVLCVIVPIGQLLVQNWVVGSGQSIAQRAWAFTALGLFSSILRALSYGLLLMALYVGGRKSEP
jgi:uncharacterized membrane protein YhaH (DUF805 family)